MTFIQSTFRVLFVERLPAIVEEAKRMRADSWVDEMDDLAAVFRDRVNERGALLRLQALSGVAADINEWNNSQWRKVVKAVIGVDVFASEPWLRDEIRSWAAENAALISTLEGDAIRQVEVLANRGVRSGLRHEEIAKSIQQRFNVSRKRASVIARDQTNKLNGQLSERRQRQAGVSLYIWRTSRDERVRGNPGGKYPDANPSHHVMEGKYCRWDDPTVYSDSPDGPWRSRASIGGVQMHPGEDYQDRCIAEPVLNSLLESLK